MPPAARLCVLGIALLLGPGVRGQDNSQDLRLRGVILGGTRTSVTESWGTVYFTVDNPGPTDRHARVLVFYPEQADVQFGRDVWVPAGSAMTAWLAIGPVPPQRSSIGRELEILLYDRTNGHDRLVLPPTEERVRNRALPYKRRGPTTALFIDLSMDDPDAIGRAGSPQSEALLFAHVARHAGGLPEHVSVVLDGFLPPTPEAFDGVDQVVLAGNRLASDMAGREALRHWVEQGGRLWVLLDLVDPGTFLPLFGDDPPAQVVDRVGLTTVAIHRARDDSVSAATRDFERPVDLVRVIPSPGAQVQFTVNGWPASFSYPLGRGKVVCTTLGSRGWHRPRKPGDSASHYERHVDLPVPLSPLEDLAAEFRPPSGPPALAPNDLRPLLMEDIGYTIVGWRTAAAILGGFVIALAALGFGLRRSRRPELVGWLAPAAALMAGAVFVVLGEDSRRAVPPTVAVAEVVDAVPGNGELAVNGLFAVYQPGSGPARVETTNGALLDLDQDGLAGQTRRRVQTDRGIWHWENLSLPAGVRTGPFRYTAPADGLRALAHFGPDGVEGRLTPGMFRDATDALITSAGRDFIAAPLAPDGSFNSGPDQILPAGQFLPGSVLTDGQQRRQGVYRQLLGGKLPAHMEGRDLLLAWAEPRDLPFVVPDGARTVGTALLIVPIEFERLPAETPVTIPRTFIPFRRYVDGALLQPTLEGSTTVDQRLRFQLPASVLPLTVERAKLVLRIRAPSRRLVISGLADGRAVPVFDGESPADPIRLEIKDTRLLQPDGLGGLHLTLAIGESAGTEDAKWMIESIGLDVAGRTKGER